MRSRRWRSRSMASWLLLGAVLAVSAPAVAAPAQVQLAADDPIDGAPRVLDGRVQAVVRVGELVVVGGTFTEVQEVGADTPLERTGLFAFDATTGVVSQDFAPVLTAARGVTPSVDALAVSPDQSAVFVGGVFERIDGSGPGRLQALQLTDGAPQPSFDAPVFDRRVYDVKVAGNRLYVAGSFTAVDGLPRRGLVTLDASTGALTRAVDLRFTGVNRGGVTTVRKIDVTPLGDRLIAIGNFTSVGGVRRVQVAMLDVSGRHAVVDSWRTAAFGSRDCSGFFDTYLRDVDFAPGGAFFVVVTTGGSAGGGKLCDSASRWETYRRGPQTYTWVDHSGGDTFTAVEVSGPVAYVGGHFRWLNNPYSIDGSSAGPGAVTRPGLAALDTRNGLPFSWNPTRSRGVGVFDFELTDTELWAGSDTAIWAGERRGRLAGFPWAGGLPLPADRLGSLPGDVVLLDPATGTAAALSHHLVGPTRPTTRSLTDVGVDWSQVRGAFMVDDSVYTGWSDGTLRRQTFDGSSFGLPTSMPLNGATLSADLRSTTQRVTSMFYDRRTGRLYFTRANTRPSAGDGGLFYRSFTPESGVVGAVRHGRLRKAGESAIGAAAVRGAFLSGGWLYYVRPSGALRKIRFGPEGFRGTSRLVNESVDWRAKGLFLSTQPPSSP